MKIVGPTMLDKGAGAIVNLASVAGLGGASNLSAYSASKHAVIGLSKSAALEMAPSGVRVNAVGPGVVETPLTEQIRADPEWYQAYADISALGRWSMPEEQTGIVVYLASDAASFVTGAIHFVDGGWLAVDGRYTPPL